MIFDMRYIPDEINFHDRDVRDKSHEILPDYKPPDFVVNALQHTTVRLLCHYHTNPLSNMLLINAQFDTWILSTH